MQSDEIRLECLKLAARPGLGPREVIDIARTYVEWVGGSIPTTVATRPGDGSKASNIGPAKADKPSSSKP